MEEQETMLIALNRRVRKGVRRRLALGDGFLLVAKSAPVVGSKRAAALGSLSVVRGPLLAKKVASYELDEALTQKKTQLERTAQFWLRSASVYASYKVCQLRLALFVRDVGERARAWDAQHEGAAEQLYRMCAELGGFFLKAGQFLAKPDLVPPAWVRRLSTLHDAAPATPLPVVRRTIEREFKKELPSIFSSFDESPIGSASVAQVHRARLATGGAEVAVKVQHPGIEPLMMQDLRNLRQFASFLQRFELPFDLLSVIAELEAQVGFEFDFEREAVSMERIERNLGSRGGGRPAPVIVPRPVKGLVTRRVLVMDFIDGVQITRLGEKMAERGIHPNSPAAKVARRNILRDLTQAYGEMILRDGYFHADPHPGNILVCQGGKVALLDYGQTKQLPDKLRKAFARLVLALAARDDLRAGQCLWDMGIVTDKRPEEDPATFGRMAVNMFDSRAIRGSTAINPFEGESTLKSNAVKTFPSDLFFVLRTTQLLRGLSTGMGVEWCLSDQWKNLAKEALSLTSEATSKAPSKEMRRGG